MCLNVTKEINWSKGNLSVFQDSRKCEASRESFRNQQVEFHVALCSLQNSSEAFRNLKSRSRQKRIGFLFRLIKTINQWCRINLPPSLTWTVVCENVWFAVDWGCRLRFTLIQPWCPPPPPTGSGSLIAALEVASGRKATVIGKPSRFMFDCISSQFRGVEPAQCLMVGDRLETDMLFGSNCGLDTMLTLTGVSQLEEAEEYRNSELTANHSLVPDYVVDSIADFLPAFEELDEQSNWWILFASGAQHRLHLLHFKAMFSLANATKNKWKCSKFKMIRNHECSSEDHA